MSESNLTINHNGQEFIVDIAKAINDGYVRRAGLELPVPGNLYRYKSGQRSISVIVVQPKYGNIEKGDRVLKLIGLKGLTPWSDVWMNKQDYFNQQELRAGLEEAGWKFVKNINEEVAVLFSQEF